MTVELIAALTVLQRRVQRFQRAVDPKAHPPPDNRHDVEQQDIQMDDIAASPRGTLPKRPVKAKAGSLSMRRNMR